MNSKVQKSKSIGQNDQPSQSDSGLPETSERDYQATAYHEAGHAVIGVTQGLTFHNISIVTTDDSYGYVENSRLPDWIHSLDDADEAVWKVLQAHAITNLAGPISAERFTGITDNGSPKDYEDIASFFVSRYEPHHQEKLDETYSNTESLVEKCWPSIDCLAKELLKKKKLNVRTAKPLIMKTLPKEMVDMANREAKEQRRLRQKGLSMAREEWITNRYWAVGRKCTTVGEMASAIFSVSQENLTESQVKEIYKLMKGAGLIK